MHVIHAYQNYHRHLAENLTALRAACTTDAVLGGENQCYFMIVGGAPVARSALVPAGSDFASAAPLKMVDLEATAEAKTAEETIMGALPHRLTRVINRQIDAAILGALDGCDAALSLEAASEPLGTVAKALVVLGEHEVPVAEKDRMFAFASPAFEASLLQEPCVSTAEYVQIGRQKWMRWAGFNWRFMPMLSGAGTSREQCYFFHSDAVGHALDLVALAVPGAVTGGIDAKTGLGWMKAKTKQLAAVLQPSGIVRLFHDGTKFLGSRAG